MSIDADLLKRVVEAAIMASAKPLNIQQLQTLFDDDDNPLSRPSKSEVEAALEDIGNELDERGFELKEVASGWRFQVKQSVAPWVSRLWEEKPQKYSRALLETLSLIAYRQPITRGEIEEIRGVAVSSHIIKTLSERNWVKVIGHKDVPGRPSMYATTKEFLDYFSMTSLEQLPTLAEIRDLDSLNKELNLEMAEPRPDLEMPADDEVLEASLPESELPESDSAESDSQETNREDIVDADLENEDSTNIENVTDEDTSKPAVLSVKDIFGDDGHTDNETVNNQDEQVEEAHLNETVDEPIDAEDSVIREEQGDTNEPELGAISSSSDTSVATESGFDEASDDELDQLAREEAAELALLEEEQLDD